MPQREESPFECIEPEFGDQLWRLEQGDLDPDLCSTLEAHVEACHACRLLQTLDRRSRELIQGGSLCSTAETDRLGWLDKLRHLSLPIAGLALAASLLSVIFLPPRPSNGEFATRGEGDTRFLRPVEGEVVGTLNPELRWTPVDGASGYHLEIRDLAGGVVWKGEIEQAELRLSTDTALERGRSYKAMLSTWPADLLPPGRLSVVFHVDGFWPTALHRLRWAHPLAQGLGAAAVGLLLLLGIRRRGA